MEEQNVNTIKTDEITADNITPPQPQPTDKPRRVRRVGTLTMGFALIIVGLALCATMLMPARDVLIVAKLSPLLLVAIGIEIIIAAAKNDGSKIKYDFLSFFMCLFLIIGAIGATFIPYVVDYIGPERDMANASISDDITNTLLQNKDSYPDVYRITVNTSLSGMRKFSGNETAKDIMRGDWVSVYAELNGTYETEEEFAQAILPLYNAVRKISPSYIQLSAQSAKNNKDPYYEINLGGGSYVSLTPETLAQNVTIYEYNEEYNVYGSPDMYEQLEDVTRNYEEKMSELYKQMDELQNINSNEIENVTTEKNTSINDLQEQIDDLIFENQELQNQIANLQNG